MAANRSTLLAETGELYRPQLSALNVRRITRVLMFLVIVAKMAVC